MKATTFFKKIFSPMLWLNFVAMACVTVALCFAVKYGIDFYTHHGEKIRVPNVKNKSFADAEKILDNCGLQIQISDTGYVRALPPDCILEQSITPGDVVKSGRVVYVIINASNTPTLTIPDVIDNSSYREARAKLEAMGFKVGEPQFVNGEKDWVYGIRVKDKLLSNGQKVSVDALLIIQVGDGMRDLNDTSVYYTQPSYYYEDDTESFHPRNSESETDDFEPVPETDDFEPVPETDDFVPVPEEQQP